MSWRLRCGPFAGKGVGYTERMEQITQEVIDKVDNLIAVHGGRKRFKDPPPVDMKPDPDYEPQVGEWFWVWVSWATPAEWQLKEARQEGVWRCDRKSFSAQHLHWYKGKCVPAEPPE